MHQNVLAFSVQRLVCFTSAAVALLFAIVVWLILRTNDGQGFAPAWIADLETTLVAVGGVLLLGSLALRSVLHRRADAAEEGRARSLARCRARLLPVVMLEAGALVGIAGWLLSGMPIPYLMVALVLINVQIAVLPVHDVDDRDRARTRIRAQRT